MTPRAVHLEALAFDAKRGRLVLFGGAVGGPAGLIAPGETWEWNGRRWLVAVDSARGPGSRSAHAMAYDIDAQRIILYGGVRDAGINQPGDPLCDTWLYDGRSWSRADVECLTTAAPAGLVYDTNRRAVILIESGPSPRPGAPRPPLVRGRMWQWRGNTWELIDSMGPRRASLEQVTYDQRRSVLVAPIFNGPDRGVWEWNGSEWRTVAADTAVAPRSRYGLAYDVRMQRVVLVGGRKSVAPNESLDDVWMWDGQSWTRDDRDAPRPPARVSAKLIEDPRGARLIYFGGVLPDGRLLNEIWSYHASRGWTRLY